MSCLLPRFAGSVAIVQGRVLQSALGRVLCDTRCRLTKRLDVALAVELFEWAYHRSIEKYKVILESIGLPDPFRARYREHLGDAIRQVVTEDVSAIQASEALALPEPDQIAFQALLRKELQSLEPFNCARYRLAIRKTEDWIEKGRLM